MASDLLIKTRKISRLLQTSGSKGLKFSDMCEVLGEILKSNIYVTSKKGKILGVYLYNNAKQGNVILGANIGSFITSNQNDSLLFIKETMENLTKTDLDKYKFDLPENIDISATILPVSSDGERLGTLLIDKCNGKLSDEDLVIAEYGATVVGMEILSAINIENETEIREKAVVQMAIASLSYSEREAIVNIFNELQGNEGLLVASKVADKVGITRSVIVNALRKFESAGVIESRSLGMKGTFIKVLNEKLFEEIDKKN